MLLYINVKDLSRFSSQNAGEESIANLDKLRRANGGQSTAQLRLKMQKANAEHAAVFRDGPTLQGGIKKLQVIDQEIKKDIKVY